MSRTRKLIIAFWIFIGCMLLWQFYDYNQGLKEASVEHPTQQHFWFTNSVATAPGAPACKPFEPIILDRVRIFPRVGKLDLLSALKYRDRATGKKITLALRLWHIF